MAICHTTEETQVLSLGMEDPLQEGMATHSIVMPRESHRQRSLAGYSPWGRKESNMPERLNNNNKVIFMKLQIKYSKRKYFLNLIYLAIRFLFTFIH